MIKILIALMLMCSPAWAGYKVTGNLEVTGNAGIGTSLPVNTLDVRGTAQMTGIKLTTSPTAGYVLTSDSVGVGTWQPAAGGSSQWTGTTSLTFNGNVGIGSTATPTVPLQVSGQILGGSISYGTTAPTSPSTGQPWYDTSSSSGLSALAVSGNIGIGTSTAPSTGRLIVTGGNVGIGSTTPRSALDVNGTVTATLYGSYVDRGEVNTPDYAESALTADGAYHDIDFSSIVPAGAVAVLIHINHVCTSTGSSITLLKKGYNTSSPENKCQIYNTDGGLASAGAGITAVDSNRVAQYRLTGSKSYTGHFTIRGWWK